MVFQKFDSFRNNCVCLLYSGMNIKELLTISFNLIYISQIVYFQTNTSERSTGHERERNSKISFSILKLYASHFHWKSFKDSDEYY
jgi:hypothetical protein